MQGLSTFMKPRLFSSTVTKQSARLASTLMHKTHPIDATLRGDIFYHQFRGPVPSHVIPLFRRGHERFTTFKEVQKKRMELLPDHPEVLIHQAVLHEVEEDYIQACECVEKASELAQRPQTLAWAGGFFGRMGMPKIALNCYDEAVSRNNMVADYHLGRGAAQRDLMSHPSAVESFSKAIELCPTAPAGYYCRGKVNMEMLTTINDEATIMAKSKVGAGDVEPRWDDKVIRDACQADYLKAFELDPQKNFLYGGGNIPQ
eukprot:TRINITY_DN10521_c0_g1_i1.p1 TRINITY_DN10521_c0_g1~~TRINITY_DN10521_c0_g1_i1.p1  ORF type:complete len:259 (-),score=45.04 TRINITY_DN10521_c0_g1_i1:8-784(-)